MRHDIRVRGRPQEGQKGQTGAQGQQGLKPGSRHLYLLQELVSRQKTQGTENGCGGTDGTVTIPIDIGIDKVSGYARRQDQQPTQSHPETEHTPVANTAIPTISRQDGDCLHAGATP